MTQQLRPGGAKRWMRWNIFMNMRRMGYIRGIFVRKALMEADIACIYMTGARFIILLTEKQIISSKVPNTK